MRQIEDEHVGPELLERTHGAFGAGRARHHFEVGLGAEQLLEPVEDDGMVVGQHQANAFHAASPSSGTTRRTRLPPGPVSSTIDPPSAVTRSRSVRGPR